MGAPATINIFAFLSTPGALNIVKYDTFGTPGALSQKTHTHIGPGCVLTIKNQLVLPPKHTPTPPIETRKFRLVGISYWAKRPTHTRISAWAVSAIKNWAKRPTHIHGFHQNDDFRWPPLGPTYVFPIKYVRNDPPKHTHGLNRSF